MNVLSTVLSYAGPVILLVAFIAALSWKRRTGKALLCTFLLLWLVTGVAFRVALLLSDWEVVEMSSAMWDGLTLVTGLGDLVGSVLLLCFAVVMRNSVPVSRPQATS